MDPDRSDQLAIWGTILFQSTNSSGSERNQRDFMTRQFERLNALGFVWTEDSIRDVFLHIASSPISPEPFRLLDLPMELITMIIDYVRAMSELNSEKLRQRWRQGLLTIQVETPMVSFASINQKFYQLCCPYLWRTIKFPGSETGASDIWTEHIFPKHGHHVKQLHLHLYDDSIPLSNELRLKDNEFDESDKLDDFYPKCGTSASKAIEFLTQCPNITQLTIRYQKSHCNGADEVLDRTEAYLARIIPAIAGLKKLRELTVKNHNPGFNLMSSDFIPTLLEKIPSLETLKCKNIPGAGPNHGAGALGLRLSQIKSLKELKLKKVRDVSDAWCEYPWQNQITTLKLSDCGNDTIGTAHRIVNHIAPRLEYLKLDCRSKDDALGWEPQNRFFLPKLSILELTSVAPNVLSSFRDCKDISDVFFHPFTFDHYVTMDGLVREIAWPKLEGIAISTQPVETKDVHVKTEKLIRDLKEFCDTRDIETRLTPPPLIPNEPTWTWPPIISP